MGDMARSTVGLARVALLMLMLAACSSTGIAHGGDAATDTSTMPGMCGAGIPANQACNNLGTSSGNIMPACTVAPLPTGQGGTIVDGIYNLSTLTYYNHQSQCPTTFILSETIAFSGGCLQLATGGELAATASGTFTVSGSNFALTRTCIHIETDGATASNSTSISTYTATPNTFTLFSHDDGGSSPTPDSVSVFKLQ